MFEFLGPRSKPQKNVSLRRALYFPFGKKMDGLVATFETDLNFQIILKIGLSILILLRQLSPTEKIRHQSLQI